MHRSALRRGALETELNLPTIFEVTDVVVPSEVSTPIYLGEIDGLPLGSGVLTFYGELAAPAVEDLHLRVEEFGFGAWSLVDDRRIVQMGNYWGLVNYGSSWSLGDNQNYAEPPPASVKWRFGFGLSPPSVAPLAATVHIVRLRVGILLA